MKVLVAENNKQMLGILTDILEKEGFEIIPVETGREALTSYDLHRPDFVCLDVMMDDMTGFDVCREIRRSDVYVPIVFISSKSDVVDKVLGLELGADDYIVKPFDFHEVIARIRAVARRCLAQKDQKRIDDSFMLKDLKVHPRILRAERDGITMELSLRDVRILKLLHDRKNEIVHRDVLLDYCWGAHIMPESRTVDWHISQLRKKVERDPKAPDLIRTVHGVGYKFEAP
jgi:DNA-binding response OmpR family regulator